MVKCGEWVAAAARAAPVTARISGSSCRCDDPGVTVFTVSATGTLRRMVRCAGKEVRPARNEMTRPVASSFLDTLERTGPVCEQNGGAPDERWCGRQGRRDEHSGYESPLQPSSRTCTTPLQPQALSSLPGISIHAPARGATGRSGPLDPSSHGFQSTHPHGVRLQHDPQCQDTFVFQSTHPHGVRPRS